ncbi:MAG: hypothetical protein OIF40_08235 [Mangrovicoccus sp.]|nr:hypothetical protein [Mangrovicoccus sp.]
MWIDTPINALQSTTIAIALAIPFCAAWVLWRWTRNPARTMAAFLLALSQPILTALAISGLSDGSGIAFYLLFLGAIPSLSGSELLRKQQMMMALFAGLFLGLALWSRPSYGVIFAASLVPLLRQPRMLVALGLGVTAVSIPVLVVLLAHEGAGYFGEALRFSQGHFLHWGNTTLSQSEARPLWADSLAAHGFLATAMGASCIAALAQLWQGRKTGLSLPRQAALAGFWAAIFWTLFMQNPENLRHLAPILFLGALLLTDLRVAPRLWAGLCAVVLALNLGAIGQSHRADPSPAPIAQMVRFANAAPLQGVVLSQRWRALLRRDLTHLRVIDPNRPGATGLHSQGDTAIYRLYGEALNGRKPIAAFPARFLGEPGAYLYRGLMH